MGKMHKAKPANTFSAPSSAVDASLASLFATSSGPVTAPLPRSASKCPTPDPSHLESAALRRVGTGRRTGAASLLPSLSESSSDYGSISAAESGTDEGSRPARSRKRRRIAPPDDIEAAYMKRLTDSDDRSQSKLRHDARLISVPTVQPVGPAGVPEQEVLEASGAGEIDAVPQHESLAGTMERGARNKSDRTVFLGNVSIEAIKSKAARKVLLTHLSSCLSKSHSTGENSKIESLRFRSTAFASGVGPKRAAYAKKELMEETTHSTHAYVVYTTQEAAEKAAALLNGTMVLDRHLRADHVARPAETDHRRCVFVGNLGFVDEEMVETETENGTKERKRRGKHPADVEEGLWRSFSKAGKIESVRVVRDKSTRVGKGIAYVQFYDENSVEAALLYNDKKFPPLLPRKLRVTRARKPNKIDERKRYKETRGMAHTKSRKGSESDKAKSFVFEGYRATKQTTHNSKGGVRRRKHITKPTTRSSRRGTAFKAAGGKRQQK